MDPESVYSNEKKGLCVIMANFIGSVRGTAHLPGYSKDIKDLQELFNELGFDLLLDLDGMRFQNLTKAKFKKALLNIQSHLNDTCTNETTDGEKVNIYDKFVLVALSHGCENGILMCSDENGDMMEEDAFISVETIINHFTHDNIPSLSGVPKCFFIQACRGSQVTQTATIEDNTKLTTGKKKLKGQQPSITRANIFIAYSTLERTYSFVEHDEGSWFIRELTRVIRERSDYDDIFGIMTKVIYRISKNTGKVFFPCNQHSHEVRVLHGGDRVPVFACGRLKTDAVVDSDDMKYTKDYQMLHVEGKNYVGFSYKGASSPCLKKYEFKGEIKYVDVDEASIMPFSQWIPASKLETFKDEKKFQISGELRNIDMPDAPPIADPGVIIIHGDKFELQQKMTPKTTMHESKLDVAVFVNGEKKSAKDLTGSKAWCFIDDKAHCKGTFQVQNGVCGINAEIYQLPVISSTLTKRMLLKKPEWLSVC